MNASIRWAIASDVPLIAELIRELGDYEKLGHEVVLEERELARHLFGPHPKAEVLLLEKGPTPLGFALFFHSFSTFLGRPGLYLEDLYVREPYRGQGHGKAMLAALARLALERDCGRFEWSVLDWNRPAIGFYVKLGAAPMSDWTVYRLTGDALSSLAGQGQAVEKSL